MSGTLLNAAKTRLANLTLIPSRGGCFEVMIDGELLYSKLATGTFPDEATIHDAMTDRMKKMKNH